MNSIGLPKMYMQQTKTYSSIELDKTENVVATAYIGLIDSVTYMLKKENI